MLSTPFQTEKARRVQLSLVELWFKIIYDALIPMLDAQRALVLQLACCSPICQRREGLPNSGLTYAPIHHIRSEFLEGNLCEALFKIIYAMIIMSEVSCFISLSQIF